MKLKYLQYEWHFGVSMVSLLGVFHKLEKMFIQFSEKL